MSEAVFSSLPDAVRLDSLCDGRDLVLVREAIVSRPGEWQTVDVVALRLGWDAGRTGEKVRCAIKELQSLGVPLVTGHAGVALATSVGMVDACLAREARRLMGLQRSIRHLTLIRQGLEGSQFELRWWE